MDVLDHGEVNLVETWGSDENIIRAARQSTDGAFRGWETDERLLRFLYRNRHMTPFEMCGAIFEVKAPIFVFREWHRHRTQCVGGATPLIFERPNDGKAYPKTLESVVASWAIPSQRPKIAKMRLRGASELVNITDAWYSGDKRLYRVFTRYGEIDVSADHIFKTPDGPRRLFDGMETINAMIQVGTKAPSEWPTFSMEELRTEQWIEWSEDYEVSNLGRVRSWLTTRGRRLEPIIKKQTINAQGRAVVSLYNRAVQVSHLVGELYLGKTKEWVLHVNDNPLDNRADNLKLGTALDNMQDQYVNEGRRKLREVPVKVERVVDNGVGATYDISVTGHHWFAADNLLVHNSYNEMSARYIPIPDENYVPTEERLTYVFSKNKQAGNITGEKMVYPNIAKADIIEAYDRCQETYEKLLENGVAKEIARIVLPVGRYSKMWASANLRNWMQFLELRNDPAAQWEIQQYAIAVQSLLKEAFPRTIELFEEDR